MSTTKEEMKQTLTRIKNKMRVTKVVVTRSVKTRQGDYFIGYSAAWDSVQNDGTHDLEDVMEVEGEENASGMTLKGAVVASRLLAMQADIGAHEQAMAGGGLSEREMKEKVRRIHNRYNALIQEDLK